MGSGSLDTVSVIDATLSSFSIHVKPLEVVVEIDRSGAKISSEEGSMCGENCSDIDSTFFAERKSYARQPFMELDYNSAMFLVIDIL